MDNLPILLAAITAFAATMAAGLLIHRFKKNFGTFCAFASGTLLALVFFEIIPDVVLLAPQTEVSLMLPILSAVAGFVFLYGIMGFLKARKSLNLENKKKLGLISTAEFCSHGFLEGLAIGVGFQFQFGLGIIVAVAVIAHDFCDGLSTLALMINAGNTVRSSLGMLFVAAVAPVLGAVTVFFVTVPEWFILGALSFLVGSFIYIGGFDLLPEAYMMNKPKTAAAVFAFGFILILLFSLIIGS